MLGMLTRYEVPADFKESNAPLTMETELLDLDSELWLFQLPHEVSTGPQPEPLRPSMEPCY